jgi:hypothetical protein
MVFHSASKDKEEKEYVTPERNQKWTDGKRSSYKINPRRKKGEENQVEDTARPDGGCPTPRVHRSDIVAR